MFTEFLQKHPMEGMIPAGTRKLYPDAEDRCAWDAIPETYREEIREMAAAYGKIPYPFRSAAGFLAFVRTGDRQADEKPYFNRRRKLCAAVLNRFPGRRPRRSIRCRISGNRISTCSAPRPG